jgi:hypothetical protein
MPEIPREVIEHKLGIDPGFKPIKQKERRYRPDRCEAIRLEVNKLLEAGFIRPVDYPIWLANPILVEKPDGSWRMCIDYTSLNKACPKDEYPCLVSVRLRIPRRRVNFYRFWMLIRAIIRSASPLTMKRKQRSSRHLGFSAIQRWHLDSKMGEQHTRSAYTLF